MRGISERLLGSLFEMAMGLFRFPEGKVIPPLIQSFSVSVIQPRANALQGISSKPQILRRKLFNGLIYILAFPLFLQQSHFLLFSFLVKPANSLRMGQLFLKRLPE
jgi:hypothetical protein